MRDTRQAACRPRVPLEFSGTTEQLRDQHVQHSIGLRLEMAVRDEVGHLFPYRRCERGSVLL
jgi:hypothetical protein